MSHIYSEDLFCEKWNWTNVEANSVSHCPEIYKLFIRDYAWNFPGQTPFWCIGIMWSMMCQFTLLFTLETCINTGDVANLQHLTLNTVIPSMLHHWDEANPSILSRKSWSEIYFRSKMDGICGGIKSFKGSIEINSGLYVSCQHYRNDDWFYLQFFFTQHILDTRKTI